MKAKNLSPVQSVGRKGKVRSMRIAKDVLILLFCATLPLFIPYGVHAQKITFQSLQAYEGQYQYVNHSTLQIAASPQDTMLYAIINQSRYKLKHKEKDAFLNSGNSTVTFIRNKAGLIDGYVAGKDTFKIIDRNVHFPVQMWYPRVMPHPEHFAYQYKKPAQVNDDLRIGNIKETALDAELLAKMMRNIVAGQYPNVHSVLIMQHNKLVFEEYFYEYTRNTLQEMRSASKSVVSALAGIAIKQGYIKNVNERLIDLLPNYHFANASPLKDKITLQDLLDNQSGVNYDVAWNKSMGTENDMGKSHDWVKYTFDLPMLDTPGKLGRYNSGNPITVGKIIEEHTKTSLYNYAAKNLFGPLHINDFEWNFKPDESNQDNFCQVLLTPRDMAKFGQLYLNNGTWNGRQVVPTEWVEESTVKHSVVQGVNYGYLWWLKYLDAGDVRYNSFAAQGNGGQKIYVFKDLDLVVVTTGGNFNTQSPADELIKKYILPGFNKLKHP
jgi:CubicO group peptidase (beta-lactamase class C family)